MKVMKKTAVKEEFEANIEILFYALAYICISQSEKRKVMKKPRFALHF